MKPLTGITLLLALLTQLTGCIIWPGYYEDEGYHRGYHYHEHGRGDWHDRGEWHDRRY